MTVSVRIIKLVVIWYSRSNFSAATLRELRALNDKGVCANMSQGRVEPLKPSEDSQLAEVHNIAFEKCIKKYGSFSGLRGLNVEDVECWRKAEFFDPDGLHKAEAEGIVGYCYAKLEEVVNEKREAYLAGYIKNTGDSCSLICVLPSWRRRGIGGALLERAESFIRSKGLGFAVAWSYQSDIAALEFLRKAGYAHRERFWVPEFSRAIPLNADVEFCQCMKDRGHEEAHMSTSVVLGGALSLYKKLDCTRVERLLCMVKYLS